MRTLTNEKRTATTRCVQMKAQPRAAFSRTENRGLNDLKKNFQNKETLNEYIQFLMSEPSHVTASIILKKLDTICNQYRTANKAIVSWSTVVLLNCEGVADAYIFLALKYLITPEAFEPFNFKRSSVEDNGACGSLALDNLLSSNRLRRLRDKLNLVFSCKNIRISVIEGLPEHTLNTEITSEFIEAAKCALHSSYDADTRTLNLSRFHAKPELGPHFCPLYVDKFFECVLHLILEQTPRVSKIILSDNYLCSLKAFEVIPNGVLDGLECLDISSNKIRELADLQCLANLKLKSLILRGNGMAKLKQDEILAILPRLHKLEGCLQSQCKQEVPIALPNLKLFDNTDANAVLFVKDFIKYFYRFFDQPNQRSQLEQYYHEGATLSLSVPETMKQVYAYRLYNRNYKTTQSMFARSSKLQVGRNAVMHALGRFPKMETNLPGATVDVQVITSHVRNVTLTGHFIEHSPTGRDLRNFQRNFVLELQELSSVWLIKTDMLCIIPPIEEKIMDEHLEPEELSCLDTLGMAVEQMNINVASPQMSYTPERLCEDTVLKEMSKKSPEINSLDVMPRLVPIPPLESQSEATLLPGTNDISYLEREIDETLLSDDTDELVINEDVLFGDFDLLL
ncbi:nuclear RNA export factor 1 [Drosophila guanche]|nr:nuclear RNA export factor 1 [Drosophila guanche]